MTNLVVDASVLLLALIGKGEQADALRRRLSGARLHAPHLIDAEVGNVLRRHAISGLVSAVEADAGRLVGISLVARRYPHLGALSEDAWTLRHNLSFYDALYVALAARLSIPLLTADQRLANAPGLPCDVERV